MFLSLFYEKFAFSLRYEQPLPPYYTSSSTSTSTSYNKTDNKSSKFPIDRSTYL